MNTSAGTWFSHLLKDAGHGWRQLGYWFEAGRFQRAPLRMLQRIAVAGQAVLLVWVIGRFLDDHTTLGRASTWALTTTVSAGVMALVGTTVLVWHLRSTRVSQRHQHPRSRTRAVAFRVGKLIAFAVLPVWVFAELADGAWSLWGHVSSGVPAWFLAATAVALVFSALKATEVLSLWHDRLEEHRHLRRAHRMSDGLLGEAKRLAAADRLTPTALCDLLGIVAGEEPPEVFDAARTVLDALHQDPDAVQQSAPLTPCEEAAIVAAMSAVRGAWIDATFAERRARLGLPEEPED